MEKLISQNNEVDEWQAFKMTEQERRKYLFLQAFYLKVKEDVAKLERNLNLPDDPDEQS